MGLVLLVLLAFFPWMWFPDPVIAPQVTAARIQRVRLGMTPAQVVAVLGRPLVMASYKGSNTHRMTTCADFAATQVKADVTDTTDIAGFFRRVAADSAVHSCDLDDERKHDRRSTLTYTRHGGLFRTYPMLWVHFDKRARVDEVYAKECATDDRCIYALGADPFSPNTIDTEALRRLFGAGS